MRLGAADIRLKDARCQPDGGVLPCQLPPRQDTWHWQLWQGTVDGRAVAARFICYAATNSTAVDHSLIRIVDPPATSAVPLNDIDEHLRKLSAAVL
jgi:hypothetical protein